MAFMESDSFDGTYELIDEHLSNLRNEYTRVELFKHDFNYPVIDSHLDPTVEKLGKST
jgi:hypothetical protein